MGRDEVQRIADGFAPLVRAVVRIPYNPALTALSVTTP